LTHCQITLGSENNSQGNEKRAIANGSPVRGIYNFISKEERYNISDSSLETSVKRTNAA
jgi:hypothetical protein